MSHLPAGGTSFVLLVDNRIAIVHFRVFGRMPSPLSLGISPLEITKFFLEKSKLEGIPMSYLFSVLLRSLVAGNHLLITE